MAIIVGFVLIVGIAVAVAVVILQRRRSDWLHHGYSNRHKIVADSLIHNFPDPVLIANSEGRIVSASPAMCALLEYSPDELVNMNVEQLMPGEFTERHRQQRTDFMRDKTGRAMDSEIICLSKSGQEIAAITRVRTFEMGGGKFGLVSIRDLRKFKDREALLKNLSEQDPLTGLANRRLFDHDFSREWHRAMRSHTPISLLMIDVDAFKLYNDYYGHTAGDTCLQKVARLLTDAVQRATDTVARYGGEEFICLLPGQTLMESARIAEELRTSIEAAKIPHENSPVCPYITVSVGVASVVPNPNYNRNLLIQAADSALYEAKARGRNKVATYTVEAEINY